MDVTSNQLHPNNLSLPTSGPSRATSPPTQGRSPPQHRSHPRHQARTTTGQPPCPRAPTPTPPQAPVSLQTEASAPVGSCATTWEGDLPQRRRALPQSTPPTPSARPPHPPTTGSSFQTLSPTSAQPPSQLLSSTAPLGRRTLLGARVRAATCLFLPFVPHLFAPFSTLFALGSTFICPFSHLVFPWFHIYLPLFSPCFSLAPQLVCPIFIHIICPCFHIVPLGSVFCPWFIMFTS